MTASNVTLEELKGVVEAILAVEWENTSDPLFKFVRENYQDIGSRVEESDFVANVIELSGGQLYDSSSSTALQSDKDFNDMTNLEKIERLAYYSGNYTIKRYNRAALDRAMLIEDPTERRMAIAKAYRSQIMKFLVNAVKRRRMALVHSFFENIASKTIAGGEKLVKQAGDVNADTQAFPFVNYIATAKGESCLDAAYNAFAIQTDETQTPLGQQTIKWMFVAQDKAGAEKLMHQSSYVNNEYRNIADTGAERYATQWTAASPDDRYCFLSDLHSITIYGRQEIPVVNVYEESDGIKITIDDHAVIGCKTPVGIVYGNPSVG